MVVRGRADASTGGISARASRLPGVRASVRGPRSFALDRYVAVDDRVRKRRERVRVRRRLRRRQQVDVRRAGRQLVRRPSWKPDASRCAHEHALRVGGFDAGAEPDDPGADARRTSTGARDLDVRRHRSGSLSAGRAASSVRSLRDRAQPASTDGLRLGRRRAARLGASQLRADRVGLGTGGHPLARRPTTARRSADLSPIASMRRE